MDLAADLIAVWVVDLIVMSRKIRHLRMLSNRCRFQKKTRYKKSVTMAYRLKIKMSAATIRIHVRASCRPGFSLQSAFAGVIVLFSIAWFVVSYAVSYE